MYLQALIAQHMCPSQTSRDDYLSTHNNLIFFKTFTIENEVYSSEVIYLF